MWLFLATIAAMAVAYWYLQRRAQTLSHSAANLPPGVVPGTLAGSKGSKPKHVPREGLDLSARPALVLYGTQTGTSKALAERLAREARALFGLELAVVAAQDYKCVRGCSEPPAIDPPRQLRGGTDTRAVGAGHHAHLRRRRATAGRQGLLPFRAGRVAG